MDLLCGENIAKLLIVIVPTYIENDFSRGYKLFSNHKHGIATEFRISLFDDTQCHLDAESPTMRQQVITRPIAITDTDADENTRFWITFTPFCAQPSNNMTDTYTDHMRIETPIWQHFRCLAIRVW